jgi:ABC-type branched-subunit amino acid transport system ATPase component
MLTVKNVDLYYGAAQALRHVSLTAETGKVTALMGRNGVGKSGHPMARPARALRRLEGGSHALQPMGQERRVAQDVRASGDRRGQRIRHDRQHHRACSSA